jgi:hypothetical protein
MKISIGSEWQTVGATPARFRLPQIYGLVVEARHRGVVVQSIQPHNGAQEWNGRVIAPLEVRSFGGGPVEIEFEQLPLFFELQAEIAAEKAQIERREGLEKRREKERARDIAQMGAVEKYRERFRR